MADRQSAPAPVAGDAQHLPVETWSADLNTRSGYVFHRQTENFLAIEPGTDRILATAMLAADAALIKAEVAIAIRADFKRRGISWSLLDHVARFAIDKGITTLESIESRDNHQAIELERERGWTASACPGDPSAMVLRMALDAPPI